MASVARCARRLPVAKILRPHTARSFTSNGLTKRQLGAALQIKTASPACRSFSTFRAHRAAAATNQTEEAPNAQAYLNSGAIAGARDLVDVKKVLVIGSGGLAIGQAGEFDYSGMLHPSI